MEIWNTWPELKTINTAKNLGFQYHESDYKYYIFLVDETLEYCVEIWKDTTKVKGINVTQNNE